MVLHPWVRKLIGRRSRPPPQAPEPQWETIKRFALLPDDFTFDNGGLTFTMKLKRRVVEQKYRDVIAQLYADVGRRAPFCRIRP